MSRRQPEGSQWGRAAQEIDKLEEHIMIHTFEDVMRKCIIYVLT